MSTWVTILDPGYMQFQPNSFHLTSTHGSCKIQFEPVSFSISSTSSTSKQPEFSAVHWGLHSMGQSLDSPAYDGLDLKSRWPQLGQTAFGESQIVNCDVTMRKLWHGCVIKCVVLVSQREVKIRRFGLRKPESLHLKGLHPKLVLLGCAFFLKDIPSQSWLTAVRGQKSPRRHRPIPYIYI